MKLSMALGLVVLSTGCVTETVGQQAQANSVNSDGRRYFERETFGGNGRTCRTCHGRQSGTVSPEEAQALYARDPSDPLFVFDGSDDGAGNGASRMLAHATIRVTIPLPANISIAEDPTARSVTFLRGIPTTLNTPALDPVLMLDGRAPNLVEQARSAIHSHFQNTEEPTDEQLQEIAGFEQTATFFSSDTIRDYALHHGAAPALPAGTTDAEIRGRRFFVDQPIQIDPVTKLKKLDGVCAQCHSGPMLNTANGFNPNFPKGVRFATARVSMFNVIGNPTYHWVIANANGTKTTAVSPDPGCVLIPNTCQGQPVALAAKITQGFFKTPTLWDLANTAPYFHDNSAATLQDVLDQYGRMFQSAGGNEPLTDQDKADILAYMQLLNLDVDTEVEALQ